MNNITIEYDSLYWLSSLSPKEEGLSRRCTEDIFPLFPSKKFYKIENKIDFEDAFSCIEENINKGKKPLLHIDMHGSEESGLSSYTGEEFSWDLVESQLSQLNKLMNNQLLCISCACQGAAIIGELRIDRPCPYRMLIAPREKISSGYLETNLLKFYRKLTDTLSIDQAFEQIKDQFSLFTAEDIAFLIFKRYIKNQLKNQKNNANEVWHHLGIERLKDFPENRPEIRKLAKALSDPNSDFNKNILLKNMSVFMHNDVTYSKHLLDEIMDEIK
ncbi:hypothetical protein [Zymomonas mobilis]|uniref:hypothetical protein n=1 Tax=Zymomonas mobilis TaxID=542 RepID=UPI0021C34B00|nr:hypothetical protein [Zymomonas mobilis]MCP9308690.1 hypothetical protein [Zymomonas mobilis]